MKRIFGAAGFLFCLLPMSAIGIPLDPVALDPISDTFILRNGNSIVEVVFFRESEEPGFKLFTTVFPKSTVVDGGIVTAPGEGLTRVSDTVEILDPGTTDDRFLLVFSDAEGVDPDPGEVRTFRIRNIADRPIPADSITVYSDVAVVVPAPAALLLLTCGLAGLAAATARRARRRSS